MGAAKLKCQYSLHHIDMSDYLYFGYVSDSLNKLSPKANYYLHEHELLRYKNFSYDLRKHSFLLGRVAAKKALKYYHAENSLQGFVFIPSEYCIDNGLMNEPILKNTMQKGNASFMGGDCTPPKSNKPPSATHFGGGIRPVRYFDQNITISHTTNSGIACLSPNVIKSAIDIEMLDNFHAIALNTFTDYEINLLKKYIFNENILKGILWAAKEALVKYLQTGFSLPIELTQISKVEQGNHFFVIYYENFHAIKTYVYHNSRIVIALSLNTTINIDEIDLLTKLT